VQRHEHDPRGEDDRDQGLAVHPQCGACSSQPLADAKAP
jgi:hypothetical protein